MIKIYGLNTCESCLYVKQLCQSNNLEFEFFDVMDRQVFREMRNLFNSTMIPQIIWDDVMLTGPNEFRVELSKRQTN